MEGSLKQFFVDLVVNNWRLKVLAFVLAAMSFYAIQNVTSLEESHEVPVLVEIEKGGAVLEQDPRVVDVTFRGSKEDLAEIEQSRLKVVVRLKSTPSTGRQRVAVEFDSVEGRVGLVQVVKIKPSFIDVTFDREIEKDVQVARPRIMGKPLLGRVEVEYEPQSVRVRGPERRLQDKDVFETEPVDVEGRAESFVKQVRVLPARDLLITELNPTHVTVHVNLVTDSKIRELTNVLVRTVFAPGEVRDVSLDPPVVKVLVTGRPEILQYMVDGALSVFVDCVGLESAGVYELPVSVHLPPGLDVACTVVPETVKVIVREARR
ncbi:MAG: hypothetical protein A2498_11845 [Lentisphaerae bacterium RIFOXYC12_FULL_60_16]|nr:MAG: hypothetical protein A2498_11845 [Lentisphaerae bacterium RIFOXYC12_FULL_60_16]OGV72587.1 MAG: hypothetical protein A2269_01160 [Lentisphaerae bacterium RIFOXYA12_FULL_60_10]OGV77291.1 MAG: hypothetical protein A2340_06190 [Lentisphaerae bacterium RIFOXYB12_FULL_60_10]